MHCNLILAAISWSRYYRRVTFSTPFLPSNNVSRPRQHSIRGISRFVGVENKETKSPQPGHEFLQRLRFRCFPNPFISSFRSTLLFLRLFFLFLRLPAFIADEMKHYAYLATLSVIPVGIVSRFGFHV